MKKNNQNLFLVSCFWFLVTCFPVVSFAANPVSANYEIEYSYFFAGLGAATSTNYAVDEGAIDFFGKSTMTSTNYAMAGKIGIAGIEEIAVISNVTPANPSRFFSDENASYVVTATTPDSDTLEYTGKQDGTTKDGPQSSSTLTWALSSSDIGRRAIQLEVVDPEGTVIAEQDAYVFRRPVK